MQCSFRSYARDRNLHVEFFDPKGTHKFAGGWEKNNEIQPISISDI